jgi:hypothetical protein
VSSHLAAFELQFPAAEIQSLALRFPGQDDPGFRVTGAAVRARGYYTRGEFIRVCRWKTPRSAPKVTANSARTVRRATGSALVTEDEQVRMQALLGLDGVGVPTASTLLYCVWPERYPILDVRALESLGVKPRSVYPLRFWLEYLAACRALSARYDVDLRTLDKALWQHSKERSMPRSSAKPGPRGDPVLRVRCSRSLTGAPRSAPQRLST